MTVACENFLLPGAGASEICGFMFQSLRLPENFACGSVTVAELIVARPLRAHFVVTDQVRSVLILVESFIIH